MILGNGVHLTPVRECRDHHWIIRHGGEVTSQNHPWMPRMEFSSSATVTQIIACGHLASAASLQACYLFFFWNWVAPKREQYDLNEEFMGLGKGQLFETSMSSLKKENDKLKSLHSRPITLTEIQGDFRIKIKEFLIFGCFGDWAGWEKKKEERKKMYFLGTGRWI